MLWLKCRTTIKTLVKVFPVPSYIHKYLSDVSIYVDFFLYVFKVVVDFCETEFD
jgi:hypothetical protein